MEVGRFNVTVARDDTAINRARVVRTLVFQDEQGIDRALDFDEHEATATHILATGSMGTVGAARIRFPEGPKKAKIERVAVLKQHRGQDAGKAIMEFIHDHLQKTGVEEAVLNSQSRTKGFYERLGYEVVGEEFEEAGIPHVKMVKRFTPR